MRAGNLVGLGIEREHGLDEVEVSKHRGGVDLDARTLAEQVFGDGVATGVRRGLQRGFKIAATPIPGGVGEQRRLLDEFHHVLEAAVGLDDRGLHFVRRESRWFWWRLVGRWRGGRGLLRE